MKAPNVGKARRRWFWRVAALVPALSVCAFALAACEPFGTAQKASVPGNANAAGGGASGSAGTGAGAEGSGSSGSGSSGSGSSGSGSSGSGSSGSGSGSTGGDSGSQNQKPQETKTDKLTLSDAVKATQGTNYENIRALEYSLLFVNETGANGGSGKINGEEVLGTGWLFDYATNAPAGQWIGYFATNLHVANALMRADDNPKYAYTGEGQTDQFFLGKYDDSGGSLSSGQDDVTYVQLKNLPKTQFAAVDFGGVGSGKYADFAVLQITLQTGSGVGPVLGSANAEAQAYTDWIEPSVAALKQISTAGDSASLFYAAETDASYLEGQRAFVAGYPGVDGAKALYYRQQTGNQWNLENYGEWTVNVPDGSSQTGGQAFDTGETSSWGGYLGLYAADYYTNATTTYHGKKYQMGGVGAVIHRSNLGEGSSGSMVMSAAKQVLGIYFGTIGTAEGDPESDYGLMQLLVVPKALAQSLQSNFYGLAADVGPYDLIAGANGSASYKDSLGTTATWLFPAAS